MPRRSIARVAGAVVALAVFAFVFTKLSAFLAQDKCLDLGGSWNPLAHTCDPPMSERSFWLTTGAVISLWSAVAAGILAVAADLLVTRLARSRAGSGGAV